MVGALSKLLGFFWKNKGITALGLSGADMYYNSGANVGAVFNKAMEAGTGAVSGAGEALQAKITDGTVTKFLGDNWKGLGLAGMAAGFFGMFGEQGKKAATWGAVILAGFLAIQYFLPNTFNNAAQAKVSAPAPQQKLPFTLDLKQLDVSEPEPT
jgi:hypothetical protein